MSKVHIKLSKDYKSFKPGEYSLEGNPIILSGINGSGKTQFLQIIQGKDTANRNRYTLSTISIDGVSISQKDISSRSFRDNIQIPEIPQPTSRFQNNNRNQVWDIYNSNLLNSNDDSNLPFLSSVEKAREKLIKEFGEEKFNTKQITQEEIMETKILDDFIWVNDDLFTNTIDKIFSEYLQKEHTAKLNCAENGGKFKPCQLGTPPWKELNDLFEKLGFHYRFKEDYHMNNQTYEINETPAIYDILEGEEPDYNSPRKIADLSDGEKTIISLVFSSLSGKQRLPKILLLDEVDATLNPFLIEAFYKIIDEYFIKKNIQVIIATHSPVTIALAQEQDTRFYEIFRKQSDRILEVLPGNYSDLKGEFLNYLKRYQGEAHQQEKYIQQIEDLKDKISSDKPIVYFEGPTDISYFIKSVSLLRDNSELLNKIMLEDLGGAGFMKTEFTHLKQVLDRGETLQSQIMFFFDCDINRLTEAQDKLYSTSITKMDSNPIKKGIENLFPQDTITNLIAQKKDLFTKIEEQDEEGNTVSSQICIKEDTSAKTDLCNYLCTNGKKEDFVNFEKIIQSIEDFIST